MIKEIKKVLVSVEVPTKSYYNEDVIKACCEDGDIIYKNKNTFLRINVLKYQEFLKELMPCIEKDIKEFNKENQEDLLRGSK